MIRVLIAMVFPALLAVPAVRAGLDGPVTEPPEVMRAYAEAGDPMSQYNCALLCQKGDGAKPDMAQALAWYRKAAAGGCPEAQHNLAVLFANGDGVAKDDKEAAKWFRAAATQGVFEAQKAMVQCHLLGIGVEKSAEQALAWDLLARRSLELRFLATATIPPTLAGLRADAIAKRTSEEAAAARRKSLGPGQVFMSETRETVRTTMSLGAAYREKVSVTKQLGELESLERPGGYFAGATEAQYETARTAAQRFVFNLPSTPQAAQPGNWLNQRLAQMAAPPPPPPLVEIPTDRSEVYPLGLHGRGIIKKYGWKHAETQHFVVHFMKASDAYPVMRYIECAYFVVTQTLALDTTASKRKSHVFIFPDAGSWKEFTGTIGFPPQVEGFAYKDELLLGAHDERDTYLKILCHETTHAVVAHFYPGRQWPLWLNEGFAEYMSAKSLALRRSHRPERYLAAKVANPLDVNKVFDRLTYGPSGPMNDVGAFYGQSEKCARVLLEKLPPQSFTKFANLAMAGNPIPTCLGEAYGSDAAKFQTLVNATP